MTTRTDRRDTRTTTAAAGGRVSVPVGGRRKEKKKKKDARPARSYGFFADWINRLSRVDRRPADYDYDYGVTRRLRRVRSGGQEVSARERETVGLPSCRFVERGCTRAAESPPPPPPTSD